MPQGLAVVLCRVALAGLLLLLLPSRVVRAQAVPPHFPASAAALRADLLRPSRSDVVSLWHLDGGGETALLSAALNDRPRDPWLGPDKLLHASFSFLWTLSCQYALVDKLGRSEPGAWPPCAASAAVLGLSKELYDGSRAPRTFFSPRDLAADALGIVLAVGVIHL